MALQWRLRWARRYLVLFISFQILATFPASYWDNISKRNSNTLSLYIQAFPTTSNNLNQRESFNRRYFQTTRNTNNNDVDRTATPYRRREIAQGVIDDDDEDEDSVGDGFSDEGVTDNSSNSGHSPQTNRATTTDAAPKLTIASVLCNSDTPLLLGPDWNGTFSTNSADGAYPSLNRSCTFTMQAMPSSINNSSSSGNGNNRPTPYVVALTFSAPIQLVCGTDYLTLYDGPDATAPILAKICGNIWSERIPTFYSTGPVLTAVFSTQESSPGSFGFTAVWYSVAPCSVCTASGRGTCSASNTCNCNNQYTGAVCETVTAGFKDFTPRSQHAMAYDPVKDMVYISGGTSLRNPFLGDLLTYTFATNKWNKITPTRSPDPRYGHFAFMYDNDLYIYGGISFIGALSDIWKFDGKTWLAQLAINPEKLPTGRVGSACVVVNSNNATKLYVFGGLTANGTTTRELNVYDLATSKWTKLDHQNSVGLSGATAVYHEATDSIYYFGGMVNQTSRNVITYQYRIYQDLWYALAPRIDPLTATPVSYWNFTDSLSFNTTILDTDDDGEPDQVQNSTLQFLPPVMYDPLTTIWTPAGVVGEDTVVMYGGMRPYGPGVNEREQSCFASSFAIYDLSCQNWTSYDASELDGVLKGRVNHTMVIRPPGAIGGSKTAYTAYIFGGFDGTDRADMLNATITIPTKSPGAINNCRVKNTQILAGNSNDIPRIGTIQDLLRQRPDLHSQSQSLGNCPSRTSLDLTIPYSGTIESGQELSFRIYVDEADLNIQYEVRTLPTSALEFKSLNVWEGYMNMFWRADHVLTDNTWFAASDSSVLSLPAVYGNSSDGPVITAGGSLNASELMSRWTKYSGLDGNPFTSAIRDDTSYIYFLASDPRRFAGYHVFSLTNNNPTSLSFSVTVTLLNHPTAVDKTPGARFNMATLGFFMLGFIFAVVLLVIMARKIRQLIEDRDASQRLAEMQLLADEEDDRRRNHRGGLNGGMALIQMDGSMLLKKPLYRVVVGVQDMGKEVFGISGSNLRHRHVRGGGVNCSAGSGLKTHSRQDSRSKGAMVKPEVPRSVSPHPTVVQTSAAVQDSTSPPRERRSRVRSDFIRDIGSAPLPLTAAEESMMEKEASALSESETFLDNTRKLSASSPDLVNVIGANSSSKDQSRSAVVATVQGSPWTKSTPSLVRQISQNEYQADRSNHDSNTTPQRPTPGETGLQRGWSLRSLGRNSSLTRSFSHRSKITTEEERECLTSQSCIQEEDLVGNGSVGGVSERGSFDSEREIIDLGGLLSPADLIRQRQEQIEKHCREEEEEEQANGTGRSRRRRRNPIKVQPISIEPLPFHSGLVPRTMAHLKRYRRSLARQHRRLQRQQQGQQQANVLRQRSDESIGSRRRSPVPSPTLDSGYLQPKQRQQEQQQQIRAIKSQGSLREVCRVASRMALRSQGDIIIGQNNNNATTDVEADEVVLPAAKSLATKKSLPQLGWSGHDNGQRVKDLEAAIELRQLAVSSHDNSSGGSGVGVGGGHGAVESMVVSSCDDGLEGGGGVRGPLGSPFSSPVQEYRLLGQQQLQQQEPSLQGQQEQNTREGTGVPKQKKPIKMRGRQEYEPGPLLAMNFLIVFPGDSGSRKVSQQGGGGVVNETDTVLDAEEEEKQKEKGVEDANGAKDTLYINSEARLPPMAVGTVFVPDPVRWWAYKAKQQLDRKKFERELKRKMLKSSAGRSKDKDKDKQQQLQNLEQKLSASKGRRGS
ncbi:hypothetical protein EC991_005501 [Linnemannia zychae]|nr:hypothetical protein EC991_005501 [Linnemannia zychae]